MLKVLVAIALFFAGGPGFLGAQSNVRIDELLAQPQARWDYASYLVMTSVRSADEATTPETAFQLAQKAGFVVGGRHPGDPLTIEDLSFLVMKAAGVPGGWEWSLFPNPRAAYREMTYHNLINTSAGPDRIVAGDEVIRTFTAAVNFQRGDK